jgi:hypothetical protein
LCNAQHLFDLPHPQLGLGKLAQDHQTVWIGQHLHQLTGLHCRLVHLLYIKVGGCHAANEQNIFLYYIDF